MSYHNSPVSAAAIANEFIELGSHEPNVPTIDQMKLQKLLFYAHAWYLAQTNKALFEENFEAWPWGPVVRSIYFQTADLGRNPVNKWMTKLVKEGQDSTQLRFETPRLEDAGLKNYIKSVWDTHKNFSGIQLSNATHLPGEPWTIIQARYGNLEQKPIIPNELIEAVFRNKMAAMKNVNTATSTAQ